MAITRAQDGTYLEVNEAFAGSMRLQPQELIGKTSVGIEYITPDQRAFLSSEIKEKGIAHNIELEIKIKKNEIRRGLFNISQITMGKNALWLTVVTDITGRKQAGEMRQNNILLKSLASVEGTGIIVIQNHRQKKPRMFFINQTARKALDKEPSQELLDALAKHDETYFITDAGCFHVKTISTYYGSPLKIIMLEQLPDALGVQEKFRQYELSSRQEQIAVLAANGRSNREIAAKLFITEYTVKDHLKEIFHRIGVSKRSELFPKIMEWRSSLKERL